jgi:flagellar basal body-associated protein FliL
MLKKGEEAMYIQQQQQPQQKKKRKIILIAVILLLCLGTFVQYATSGKEIFI